MKSKGQDWNKDLGIIVEIAVGINKVITGERFEIKRYKSKERQNSGQPKINHSDS